MLYTEHINELRQRSIIDHGMFI